ncbi:MAG: energy transducer TonB [Taibaiella sp.]|nr:energy transducer TonB [Taibaiella sp.]
MKTIVTISLLAIGSLGFAQKRDDKDLQKHKNGKEVFRAIPEENKAKPEYDLSAYLRNNPQYPNVAYEAGIQGKVVVEFIIDKDGSVDSVRVLRGKELGGGLPEEAVRVVANMPPWKPATQNGYIVKSYMTLPIDFKLNVSSSPDRI